MPKITKLKFVITKKGFDCLEFWFFKNCCWIGMLKCVISPFHLNQLVRCSYIFHRNSKSNLNSLSFSWSRAGKVKIPRLRFSRLWPFQPFWEKGRWLRQLLRQQRPLSVQGQGLFVILEAAIAGPQSVVINKTNFHFRSSSAIGSDIGSSATSLTIQTLQEDSDSISLFSIIDWLFQLAR